MILQGWGGEYTLRVIIVLNNFSKSIIIDNFVSYHCCIRSVFKAQYSMFSYPSKIGCNSLLLTYEASNMIERLTRSFMLVHNLADSHIKDQRSRMQAARKVITGHLMLRYRKEELGPEPSLFKTFNRKKRFPPAHLINFVGPV